VLTPLIIRGSRTALLVNRGWVAAGPSRERLPRATAPRGEVALQGLAVDPQTRYVELAHAAPQGRLWQNLDMARYAAQSRLNLQPVLLLQTTPFADGLLRDWPRPDTGVAMHASYAFQWYSLATTLGVLWVAMNVRRHREGE
jgi:surfeit locus 1 family protein